MLIGYLFESRSVSSPSKPGPHHVDWSQAEVAKTRLQLQGELAKDGGVKVYNSAIDVLSKTFRNEGIRGLQRGLAPAVSDCVYFRLARILIVICSTSTR